MDNQTNNEQTSSISVVFWVHLKSSKGQVSEMERFKEAKTASDYFDWVESHINKRDFVTNEKHIMTNGDIIR